MFHQALFGRSTRYKVSRDVKQQNETESTEIVIWTKAKIKICKRINRFPQRQLKRD